jgi:hypothetical protein
MTLFILDCLWPKKRSKSGIKVIKLRVSHSINKTIFKMMSSFARIYLVVQKSELCYSSVGTTRTPLCSKLFPAPRIVSFRSRCFLHSNFVNFTEQYFDAFLKDLRDKSDTRKSEVIPLSEVVLQIFMVKFCVSKIQSWHHVESTFKDFLSAIYYGIQSTCKASH